MSEEQRKQAERICKAADQLERVQQQTALAYMEGMATGAALALAGLTKPEEAKAWNRR